MTTLQTVLAITIGVNYVCDIVKTDPSKAVVKDHNHALAIYLYEQWQLDCSYSSKCFL